MLQVSPLLSRKEASAEAVNAVAYATKYHSGPFWSAARKEVENGALAVYSNSAPPDRVQPRLRRRPKCPDDQTSEASLPHGERVGIKRDLAQMALRCAR